MEFSYFAITPSDEYFLFLFFDWKRIKGYSMMKMSDIYITLYMHFTIKTFAKWLI